MKFLLWSSLLFCGWQTTSIAAEEVTALAESCCTLQYQPNQAEDATVALLGCYVRQHNGIWQPAAHIDVMKISLDASSSEIYRKLPIDKLLHLNIPAIHHGLNSHDMTLVSFSYP